MHRQKRHDISWSYVQQSSIRYDNGVIKMTIFDKAWGIVKESDEEWSKRMQAKAGSDWMTCPNCRGSGMQGSGDRRGSCDDCGGIRKVPPCSNCGGPTYGVKDQEEGWPKCRAGCN